MVNWLHCQLGKETFTPEDFLKFKNLPEESDISVPKYRVFSISIHRIGMLSQFILVSSLTRVKTAIKPEVTDWMTHITTWASCDSKKIPNHWN